MRPNSVQVQRLMLRVIVLRRRSGDWKPLQTLQAKGDGLTKKARNETPETKKVSGEQFSVARIWAG